MNAMFKFSNFILGGKSILVLVVLFLVLNSLMKNTISTDLVLDLKFGYSAREAYSILESMGPEVRQAYLKCLLIFDLPYMVIYTLLFIQLFNFLFKDNRIQVFTLGILIFDFLENLTIFSMIQIFPDYSSFLGFSASFFTSAKWIFVALVITLSIVGAVFKIFSKKRQGFL